MRTVGTNRSATPLALRRATESTRLNAGASANLIKAVSFTVRLVRSTLADALLRHTHFDFRKLISCSLTISGCSS